VGVALHDACLAELLQGRRRTGCIDGAEGRGRILGRLSVEAEERETGSVPCGDHGSLSDRERRVHQSNLGHALGVQQAEQHENRSTD
jgi:hypothetical protein